MSDTAAGLLQIVVLVAALAACYRPLGDHIARAVTSTRHLRVERGIYRLVGVDGDGEQSWAAYLRGVLAFSAVSVLLLYGFQRVQNHLWLSLGLWRAAVLIELHETSRKGKRRADKSSLALLDIKQAVDASAPWAPNSDPGLSPAARVLSGAQRLAPALGTRMLAASMLDRSVFIRELLPQDLKVELDQIAATEARGVAYYLGRVVGRAHRRQLDRDSTRRWSAEMASHRTKNIDAPSWLWQALIQLVALHEHGYLEHCRRYALAADRTAEPGLPEIAA